MTLTIELSDRAAAQVRAAAKARGQDMGRFVATIFVDAMGGDDMPRTEVRVLEVDEEDQPKHLHSVMEFAGVGAGRPGAVGDNVQSYIDAMRDECEERDIEIERFRNAQIQS